MLILCLTITFVLIKFIGGRVMCFFLFIKVLLFCFLLNARPAMNSNPASVLVIDDFHPSFVNQLEASGLHVNYRPDFDPTTELNLLNSAEIIAVRSKMNFTSTILSDLPNLTCIARGGAGMDNIDEAFAKSKDIVLLNAPEGNRDAVAEHCIGLLLNISNKISQSCAEVKNGQWNREANRGWEIGGKTIGIVGFGNTGSSFAQKLSGFDANVVAYDKYQAVESPFAIEIELDEMLKTADIISFNVPLTAETKGMINSELIGKMKDGVVLLNTSRGGICKLSDVQLGIIGGKIKSFGTDVLENENLNTWTEAERRLVDELIASNQVLITPHVAGWTFESYQKIADVLAHKIIEYTTKLKNI
jgi:D-3-phosphoglycerate dehydrogenase